MKKVIFQFLVLLVLFFSSWFLLSKINFTSKLHLHEFKVSNERRLDSLFSDFYKKQNDEVQSDTVNLFINELKERICRNNNIDPNEIKIHLLYNDNINAFSLPGKHVILFTGLIKFCNNAEELSAVMSHEFAHIEHNHIMKKMAKEAGFTALLIAISGNNSSQIAKKIIELVSSSAFDRKLESDADTTAVHYLANANINPENFANFLNRISEQKNDNTLHWEWISTHPDPRDRAEEVLVMSKNLTFKTEPLCSGERWKRIQSELGN